MIAYASRTGTKRNLAGLRDRGWRLLVSPKGMTGPLPSGFGYALDNGAWTAHQQGTPFDSTAFRRALDKFGPGADWVALPDIVAGGGRSLDLSIRWRDEVLDHTRLALLPVQDGMEERHLDGVLGERVGIFVGGSTDWKLATLATWCRLGRQLGIWVHVGRVNTARRIRACALCGATSFDGTSATRYAVNLPRLDHARRQRALRLGVR